MRDAERWGAVVVGLAGLIAFAGGSLLTRAPLVDVHLDEALDDLTRRRSSVLAGSLISLTGAALLLWPITLVATSTSEEVWPSLAWFSIAVWVLGFALLSIGSLLLVAVAWRGPAALGPSVARLCLDASHLAIWSVSAPVGAIAVVATTAVGLQADAVGFLVVVAAVMKVATVVVELAGTGHKRGWNAGGWAAGSSGFVTVAWFGCLLDAIR